MQHLNMDNIEVQTDTDAGTLANQQFKLDDVGF